MYQTLFDEQVVSADTRHMISTAANLSPRCLLGLSLQLESMGMTRLEGSVLGTCQTVAEGAAKQSDEAN